MVEEKFGEYFGYIARCEEDFGIWTLKFQKLITKLDENVEFDSSEI